MSAIFGFTFHIGRMTEVLTPDIYRAHWIFVACRHFGKKNILRMRDAEHICYKYSFFVRMVSKWNNLPSEIVESNSLQQFYEQT